MSENGGRAVLVTGATGGIGKSICELLGANGYSVLAHFNRDSAGAAALRTRLQEQGVECSLVQADLADPDGPSAAVRATRKHLARMGGARLYGLVNNAATLLGPSLSEVTSRSFDEMFALNVRAPLLMSKELLPNMAPGGSIVNVSSAAAHFSSPGNLLYAMSKSALESLTRNLAEAIAPKGVRVNAVVPGYTDNGHPAFRDAGALAYMSSFSVLGGVATPTIVAEAIYFLLSDHSARTTGSLLDVSGGSTLAPRGNRAGSTREVISERITQQQLSS